MFQFRNRIRRVFRKVPCCGSTCCCPDSSGNNKKPKSNVVGSDSVIDKTRHQLYASTANINGGVTQIHHQIAAPPTANGSSLQTVIHHNNNPQHIQHVIQNQTVQLMEQSLAPHSHSSSSGGSSSTTSSTGTSSGGSTALDNSQQQLQTTTNKVINNNNEQKEYPYSRATEFSQMRNMTTQGHPLHRSSENILMTPQTLNNEVQNLSSYPSPIPNGIITQHTHAAPTSVGNNYLINHLSNNNHGGSISQPASIRATPINNQFELYPQSNQVISPFANRHSTTPTPLFTANGQIYAQSPPPYDINQQQLHNPQLSPIPQQQLVRTNSFTQATQNQPIPLNNLSSGPISLGPHSVPHSIPLSSLPASPSAINATTVYYNPIHGNSHPNDASASIIFAARNGLSRKRVFSSPNHNNAIQKITNSIYNQTHSNAHHRTGSCSSILSHSNNVNGSVNVNGSQIRNSQLPTPSNDLILRNQVQNEVLYNHIHQQQNHFRRPKSHSPSAMQPYPPTSSPNPKMSTVISTTNGPTTATIDHYYDKIHNRQLSSSSAGFYLCFYKIDD